MSDTAEKIHGSAYLMLVDEERGSSPLLAFSTSLQAMTTKYFPLFAKTFAAWRPNPDEAPVTTTNSRRPIFKPPRTLGISFSWGTYSLSERSVRSKRAARDVDLACEIVLGPKVNGSVDCLVVVCFSEGVKPRTTDVTKNRKNIRIILTDQNCHNKQ
jgi:hypothetical protein